MLQDKLKKNVARITGPLVPFAIVATPPNIQEYTFSKEAANIMR